MNKAEDILKQCFFKSIAQGEELDEETKAGLTLIWLQFKREKESLDYILDAMREYAKEACEEQRRITAFNYDNDKIINDTEPKYI